VELRSVAVSLVGVINPHLRHLADPFAFFEQPIWKTAMHIVTTYTLHIPLTTDAVVFLSTQSISFVCDSETSPSKHSS